MRRALTDAASVDSSAANLSTIICQIVVSRCCPLSRHVKQTVKPVKPAAFAHQFFLENLGVLKGSGVEKKRNQDSQLRKSS